MKTCTLGLTGDVMIGRIVNEVFSRESPEYIWGDMLAFLQATDMNLINLEAALTTSQKEVLKVFNFKADPEKVQSLIKARIDVANLANNHALDYDRQGLVETLEVLDRAGIYYVGAGLTLNEAKKPIVWQKGDLRVGILGYTDNEPSWRATKDLPGTAYVSISEKGVQEIIQDIEQIRDKVDILIVTMHWGPNMRTRPTEQFRRFARTLIDNNVDIFHGHSAHIFQGVEVYNKKLILYDTGDFVDDYYVDPVLRNDYSFFFLIDVTKKGIERLRLVPTCISNCQVNRAAGDEEDEICDRMRMLSLEFETKFEKEDRQLVLQIT